MTINRFQRSRSLILESHQHTKIKTVSSETTRPIELEFHMNTPDQFNWSDDQAIYCKTPFKYILCNQKANGLGTWYVAKGMWALLDLHKL